MATAGSIFHGSRRGEGRIKNCIVVAEGRRTGPASRCRIAALTRATRRRTAVAAASAGSPPRTLRWETGVPYPGTVVHAEPFGLSEDIGCPSDAACRVRRRLRA